MKSIFVNGKLQNADSVNTNLVRKELNDLTLKETEIQDKIDNHITNYLDCIRRKIHWQKYYESSWWNYKK